MRNDAPPPAARVDWGGLALLALGIFGLWLGLSDLIPTVKDVSAGAAVVEFRPVSLIPLPLACASFALASIALIPRTTGPTGKAKKEADRTFWRRATRLMCVAAAGVVVAAGISPIGQAVMAGMLADRGYMRCSPAEAPTRHAPLRWHRGEGRCW